MAGNGCVSTESGDSRIARIGNRLLDLYSAAILDRPRFALLFTVALVGLSTLGLPRFAIDASSDSLLLEADEALELYRAVRARYGSDDYLILTYAPEDDLFSESVLDRLEELRRDLASIEQIEAVTSILDVPLFESPPLAPRELSSGAPTLTDERTDLALARTELRQSPLYRNRVLSADGTTTAMQLDLERDERYLRLLDERDRLRSRRLERGLTAEEKAQLREVGREIDAQREAAHEETAAAVASVRAVIADYDHAAEIHLGGLPMISTDMLAFIRHDLAVFGMALVVMLSLLLTLIFRSVRWVLLPLLVCAATILSMMGLLGLMRWPVTVVSSNFVSLLLILTLSLTVHLAVRYRELCGGDADADQYALVRETVRTKFAPALLTAVTTMVAFASLTVAGIRPVIDFGWMMVTGIAVAFLMTFLILPATLVMLSREREAAFGFFARPATRLFARLTNRHPLALLGTFLFIAVASVYGLTRLSVDNRFIDYFDESTEIYRGMSIIDRKLGGTTPLDVVVDAPADASEGAGESGAGDDLGDLNELYGQDSAGFAAESAWMNTRRLDDIARMHEFLAGRPEIGKVLSLDTTMYVFRQLAGEDGVDNFTLSVIYERMPEAVREAILWPYISREGDQIRFAARVYESSPDLERDELLGEIRTHFVDEIGVDAGNLYLTGVFVLYNNVLKSLFDSQVKTAGAVSVAVLLMFAVAFRSITVGLVALVVNVFGAAVVLAVMGVLKVPLDIMSITIAAIVIGIGVDDTVHYAHRYRDERARNDDHDEIVRRCHASVGFAMFYTTVTIILGFSVLAFSNFVPTIYFGLLTGFAMAIALFANLTLLPLLLQRIHAFASRSR